MDIFVLFMCWFWNLRKFDIEIQVLTTHHKNHTFISKQGALAQNLIRGQQKNEECWMKKEEWGRWMMSDEWWAMNDEDEWWAMNDEWGAYEQ